MPTRTLKYKIISRKLKKLLRALAWGIVSTRLRYSSHSRKKPGHTSSNYSWPEPLIQPEVYLPSHVWDSQNPGERFASVGDLCSHIGDQLPMCLVKRIARDVLKGLVTLHETRGRAHGDLNQDCILISPRDMKALVSHFYGGDGQSQHTTAPQSSEMSHPASETLAECLFNTGAVINLFEPAASDSDSTMFKLCYPTIGRPRHDPFCDSNGMRPPEALLDAPQSTSADIWTLGCLLYELITGESLFDPFFQTADLGLTSEESHLIQMIELLGEFPRDVVQSGENGRKWFKNDGSLRLDTTYYPAMMNDILQSRMVDSPESEVASTADLLAVMLRLRPCERARAADLISHPWFNNADD